MKKLELWKVKQNVTFLTSFLHLKDAIPAMKQKLTTKLFINHFDDFS